MDKPLSSTEKWTVEAMSEMLITAATFGKKPKKVRAVLLELERCATRAAGAARTYANVYPIRGKGSVDEFDATREMNRLVAELFLERVEARRVRPG